MNVNVNVDVNVNVASLTPMPSLLSSEKLVGISNKLKTDLNKMLSVRSYAIKPFYLSRI